MSEVPLYSEAGLSVLKRAYLSWGGGAYTPGYRQVVSPVCLFLKYGRFFVLDPESYTLIREPSGQNPQGRFMHDGWICEA